MKTWVKPNLVFRSDGRESHLVPALENGGYAVTLGKEVYTGSWSRNPEDGNFHFSPDNPHPRGWGGSDPLPDDLKQALSAQLSKLVEKWDATRVLFTD